MARRAQRATVQTCNCDRPFILQSHGPPARRARRKCWRHADDAVTRPCTCWSPTDSSRRTSSRALARRRGIAAHVESYFLNGFLREVAEASAPGLHIVDRDTIEGELLALFHDGRRLASADLAPVRGYLVPDDADRPALDRRRAQLAAPIAELFDEYAYSRPEMLDVWRKRGADRGRGTSRCSAGSASCGWRCSGAAGARSPPTRR